MLQENHVQLHHNTNVICVYSKSDICVAPSILHSLSNDNDGWYHVIPLSKSEYYLFRSDVVIL